MKFRTLHADEIEVKVKQVKNNGSVFLLYKTARTDMDLLDETVGPENWQCAYETIKDNLYCKIGIWCEKLAQWIWKQDCGIESREDGDGNEKKGEASDAFKRAGFKWGIGRELYTAPFIWVSSDVVPTKGVGNGYKLADPFAKFYVSKIEYNDKREIKTLIIKNSKHNTVYTFGKTNETIKTAPPVIDDLGDEIPFDEPLNAHADDWMPENAFAGACERAQTAAELQELVNSQHGNPNIKTLLPYASARKAEIMEQMGV